MRRLKRDERIETVAPRLRWLSDFGEHGDGVWSDARFITGYTVIRLGGEDLVLSFGEEIYDGDERL